MTTHRGTRLGCSLVAVATLFLSAAGDLRAQPGFGPDPFWPYNSQYTPYTTAIGPAMPEAGQGGSLNARSGVRNANQFQEYLDSIQGQAQGPGRNLSDRSNVGMPYYRSAVDPQYKNDRRIREYQPNTEANDRFVASQRRVSDVYYRYYSERDPARRSELLGEYRDARRAATMALSGRGTARARASGSSARTEAGANRGGRAGSAPSRDRASSRTRGSDDLFGPAPDVPAIGARRSSSTTTSRPRRSLPSDVLDRSQAMDRGDDLVPSPRLTVPGPRPRLGGNSRTNPATPDAGPTSNPNRP